MYVDLDSSGYSTSGGVKEVRRAVAAVPINLIVLGLSLVCGLGQRKGGEEGSRRARKRYQKLEGEYLFATRSIEIFPSPLLGEEEELEGGKTPMVKDG